MFFLVISNGDNCRKSAVVSTLATSRATPHPRQRELRETKEGTPARLKAEREYEAAWSAYKIIADQV